MSVELKVPSVGESITEVQVGEWLKAPGDAVELDEPIVVIETDKVTVELPAPAAGTLSEIRIESGQTAEVGDVIGAMEEGPAGSPAAGSGAGHGRDSHHPERGTDSAAARPAARTGTATHVMPAARRALAERGLEADQVAPSGPGGRLLKEDVERHAARPAARTAPSNGGSPSAGYPLEREEEVVPMTPMRKRIAARLVESQRQSATLTTFNEIDLSRVVALRKEHQERFVERHGVKLGFMSFFVKGAVEALKKIPQVNAEVRTLDGGEPAIVYRNYFDIGIAVGGGKGLVVPVLRNAERMSFAEIELAIADFAARAKAGKLALDELTGGTFTISNGGVYGSLMSTPILNPPQSGILGLHAIQDRPVVRGGEVVVRPMMYVALSYDHRVIDGRESVTFLKTIKEALEDPARILLEI